MEAWVRRLSPPRNVVLEIGVLCDNIYVLDAVHLELEGTHELIDGGRFATQEAKGGQAQEWRPSESAAAGSWRRREANYRITSTSSGAMKRGRRLA